MAWHGCFSWGCERFGNGELIHGCVHATGHALLVLLFSLFMLINEKKFMKGGLGEIFTMCFQGRYMMFMMVSGSPHSHTACNASCGCHCQ